MFIFADDNQFEQLQPIVTNAGAKALLFPLKLGETKLVEFVQYVRSVAEKKGIDDMENDISDKGVVVVRFRGKGNTEAWALEFIRDVDQELGQRSVEQNEFLDAILTKNAKALKQTLQEESLEESARRRPQKVSP